MRRAQTHVSLLWEALRNLFIEDQGRLEESVLARATSLMAVLNVELSASIAEAQAFFIRGPSPSHVGLGLMVTPINRTEPTEHLPHLMLFGADIIVQVMGEEITLIKHRWHKDDGVFASVHDAVGCDVKATTDLRARSARGG
jgi:hypothetical protein